MNKPRIWAVVPAAGIGKRMQSAMPKQYLPLLGASVLQHTLNTLLSVDDVAGLVVALQQDDAYWNAVALSTAKPVVTAGGGTERCDSVLNALQTLSENTDFDMEHDWVLVHDAVRPCVRVEDIRTLIERVAWNEAGGLLAVPVRDTMKRQGDNERVRETVDREGLWHALTPQLFACKALKHALQQAVSAGASITDEASAMEYAGYRPLLVQGHEDNIKITRPGDVRLAELLLQEQQRNDGPGNGNG